MLPIVMDRNHPWLGIRPFRRHSLVLLVSGFIYMGIGLSILTWVPYGPRWNALAVPLAVAPPEFWTGVFIFAGCLAVLSARWPVVHEKWGYSVLTGLSAGWAASYFVGYIIDQFFSELLGEQSLSGGFVWALISFLWWATSGLVNPEDTIVVMLNEQSVD